MMDIRIILHILYHSTLERQVRSYKIKKECTDNASLIFFPVTENDSLSRLNRLDSMQHMQRLAILYSMLWKCN